MLTGKWDDFSKSRSLPKYLTTTEALVKVQGMGFKLPQEKKHYDYESGIITTRERNFLEKDFVFEALVTFGPDDGIAHIGIGTGLQESSANRRENSLFIRFHAPHHGAGGVELTGWQIPTTKLGTVMQPGVHLVRMIKTGDSLTFQIDPENDGPTDDDFETTIPDLRARAPFLNTKNSTVFLGGTGTFAGTRLEIQ